MSNKIKFVSFLILSLILVLVMFFSFSSNPEREMGWQARENYRFINLEVYSNKLNGFSQLQGEDTKILFSNRLTTKEIEGNRFLLSGSGVAIGDVDGDGLSDIYFCKLNGNNALYKNLGNWEFKDVTEKAGVPNTGGYSTGSVFADLDGDADLDLIVSALGGPNSYFLNNGTGTYTDYTKEGGLESYRGSTSMALSDVDNDGDLDLYVANFKVNSVESLFPLSERMPNKVTEQKGNTFIVRPEFMEHYRIENRGGESGLVEKAELDILYINDGTGRFEKFPVDSERFGDIKGNRMTNLYDWGLFVRFQDLDNDGDPDIYVCNDYNSPDRIWINDGRGYFKSIDLLSMAESGIVTSSSNISTVDV